MEWDQKLKQMKEAMFTIIDDMTEEDSFSIITFESKAYHFELDKKGSLKKVSTTNLFQAQIRPPRKTRRAP